jgi:uncharacterized membrane protein
MRAIETRASGGSVPARRVLAFGDAPHPETPRLRIAMTDLAEAHRLRAHAVVDPPSSRDDATVSRTTAVLLIGAAAAWTAVVGALAIWRHQQFLSHRYDLGNMVQAVWSTAAGRPLEMTDGATGDQIVRLAAHVDPILVLFVPLWWVNPAPETLIVAQAAILAAGVYPVVRLALKYTGSQLAAGLLAAWYLVFPWTVWNAFNDFHPVTLAIPLVLYCVWFLDEHRLGAFAVCAVLALMTGELIGLTVAALGVWYAIRYRRHRAGLGIAFAGAAWSAICIAVVIPAFNDGRPSRYYSFFEGVGGSPAGLVRTVFTDPGAVLEAVTTGADIAYVVLLLFPTAFLALGQPLLLAVAGPQLGVNLLSEQQTSVRPWFQYAAPIVPLLVAATIVTLGRLPARALSLSCLGLLAVALSALALFPPVPGGDEFVFGERESAARVDAMRDALRSVPERAALTTTNRLGAHLSGRREIHLFPGGAHADWAVLDTRDSWLHIGATYGSDAARFRRLISKLERDEHWRLVFDQQGVRVYRRVS